MAGKKKPGALATQAAPKKPKQPKEPKASKPKKAKEPKGSKKLGEVDPRQLSLPGFFPERIAEALDAHADPRALVGKKKHPLFLDDDQLEAVEIHRHYAYNFEPEEPHLLRWNGKFIGTRARAEREALKARTILRKPLTQYLYEDGLLIEVHVFDKNTLKWHLRWRRAPDGTVIDEPLKDEKDPHGPQEAPVPVEG